MFVVLRTMTEILLLNPRDLRELARFQSREPMLLNFMRFSPDGGLLVAGTAAGYVHVWDLRRIPPRLEEMHLDWGLPPIGPPPSPSPAACPLEVDLRLDRDSLVERASNYFELPDYRRASPISRRPWHSTRTGPRCVDGWSAFSPTARSRSATWAVRRSWCAPPLVAPPRISRTVEISA